MHRPATLTLALLACTAASTPPESSEGDASFADPPIALQLPSQPGEAVCRDRIHKVREERGLPAIQPETADSEDPLLIAAVDHRIDGCSVMVMKYDSRDVRPIPKPDEGTPLLRRIQ
jgi:hypothetical protein